MPFRVAEEEREMNPAVVVVDMLDDFVTGPLANARSERIIPRIAELLDRARDRGWVVCYANDAHLPGDPEEKIWGQHAMAGTAGAQVIARLAPHATDVEFPKRYYSSFYETGLGGYLRQRGIDTVIIVGQHTHMCVRHTSADAFNLGLEIIVPTDGVEAFTDADHEGGLEYLRQVYGASTPTISELLASHPNS